jgi:hypothetical protein
LEHHCAKCLTISCSITPTPPQVFSSAARAQGARRAAGQPGREDTPDVPQGHRPVQRVGHISVRITNKQTNKHFHPSSSLFSPTFFARFYSHHSLSSIMFSITAHNCASLALFTHSLHDCSHRHYAQLFYGRANKASP